MTEYAKLYRNIVRAGLCVALVCNVQIASAAYAQLTPPPGYYRGPHGAFFSSGPNPTLPQWMQGRLTANGLSVSASATLNSGGRGALVPVVLEMEKKAASRALAGRVAAGLVGGPVGMIIAGWTIYEFLQNPLVSEWWGNTGYAWDSTNKEWRFKENTSCFITDQANPCSTSPVGACTYQATKMGRTFVSVSGTSGSMTCVISGGFQISISERPGQTVDRKADFETEVRPTLEETDLPVKVPNILPIPWPVKDPVINPGTDGKPRPFFIPTGDPVPNPKFDPSKPASADNQPWIRPGVQVVPSPTPDDPWRVDVQPIDVPQPTSNPDDTPDPNEDPDTKPEPKNDADLCEKYPDILACAKPELDTPDGEIPKAEREVALEDKDLFGGGSCPADAYATVGGQELKVWNWQQSCDYITRFLKPVILVLGAFSALMIVSGGTKE